MASRYTEFPNLHAARQPPAPTTGVGRSSSFALEAPLRHLIRSWAFLLRGYTHEDAPTFRVDAESVTVNTLDGQSSEIKYVPGCEQGKYTGICTTELLIFDEAEVVLHHEQSTSTAVLFFSSAIPASHIPHMIEQLLSLVRQQERPELHNVSWSSVGEQGMSILNWRPRFAHGPKLLHYLLKEPTEATVPAIDFRLPNGETRKLSYAELDIYSTRFALQLQSMIPGLSSNGCQEIVPLLLPQCPELYVAILAILKLGAAFCPLHLDAPEERLKFIVNDVAAKAIITTSELRHLIRWDGAPRVMLIDDMLEENASHDPEGKVSPNENQAPESLAYVMYTSGSTGTPKGVKISHMAIVQTILAHDEHIPVFQRFLQFAAPTFDVFIFEVFFPFYKGKTVVGCNRAELLSDLPAVINALEVDAAELTPTVVGNLIQRRSRTPKLKALLTIGEMLTQPVIDEFGGSPSAEGILHAMYGPTEATVHCTVATRFSSSNKVGIIGIPLGSATCLIIDSSASQEVKVLPIGHVGELAIAGNQLASGYINRPQQNASAFVDTRRYGRIYRTGDKARLLPQGLLECLGRISTGQVKLRGQRIELGEIEQAAYKSEGIKNAVAQVIDGTIVLFCTTSGDTVTAEDVLGECRCWLPAFIVPGDVVILKAVPQLSSGKIDLKKLKTDYEQTRNGTAPGQHTHMTAMEQDISKVVEELLGFSLGIDDSLLARGIDSIKAIQLASKLRFINLNTKVNDIVKAKSIRGIAEIVASAPKSAGAVQETPNFTDGWMSARDNTLLELAKLSSSNIHAIDDIIPCTPLQMAMLAETLVDDQVYCNWIELQCSKSYDFQTLQSALARLVGHNEILRTGFVQLSDQSYPFVQVIWKELENAQIIHVASIQRSFRIATGGGFLRPFRVQVNNLDTKPRLVFQIHHALYDGWSWDNIVSDLDLILRGHSTIPRPQFRKIVDFYCHPSATTRSVQSREYWQGQLQNASSCKLPDMHGKTGVVPSSRVLRKTLETRLDDVMSASKIFEISPQAIFQAAFTWLLSAYTGSKDVIFGSVSSGRTLPIAGVENIIGPCISTLPVRLNISHARTACDLFQTVNRLNRQMLEYCELPLREMKQICGIDPRDPLFDTLFVWQPALREQEPHTLAQIDNMDYLEFTLVLEIEPRKEMTCIRATYQNAIIPEEQIDLLLRQIDQLVKLFIRDSQVNLTELGDFLADDILSIENMDPKRVEVEKSLSCSVEVLAEQNPSRPALEFSSQIDEHNIEIERISYSELNKKANQIGSYLLSKGVRPDDLIAVCIEKSVVLYLAILAIIKTGAGYLPLAPETPDDRKRNILRKSRAKFCLCQSFLIMQDEAFEPLAAEDQISTSELASGDLRVEQTREKPPNFSSHMTFIYVDNIDFTSLPTSNLAKSYHPSHLAYAVFTSGTTGVPKGVLVTQGNLMSNLVVLSDIYPVADGSRMLQSCSQAFDVSVFEIFFAWFKGMCLCSAPPKFLYRDLENAIRLMKITHLSLTPTVAALVEPENVPAVSFLVTAGEGVTSKVYQSWVGKGLYQGYGPSETTNICTVKPNVTVSDKINNIGPPLPNTSVFVLQNSDKILLAPRGGVGEFCFGGEQVFRGYLDMPELNAQKIIEHPRLGRLYRSGDYGRLLYDGSLEFLGRDDDQVKIRGQRVETGEIDSALCLLPNVADSITCIVDEKASLKRLVTYWVPKECSNTEWRVLGQQEVPKQTISKLFDRLKSKLPSYMISTMLVPISSMPRTSQAKIDRRKLLEALPRLSKEHVEFCSQSFNQTTNLDGQKWLVSEHQILEVLCASTNFPRQEISRHTSFFSLGLDSISAISFAKMLRRNGFHNADAYAVLKYPTVSALSQFLERPPMISRSETIAPNSLCNIFDQTEISRISERYHTMKAQVSKILPCTPLQEAMLLSYGWETTSAYNNHIVFEIHGNLERLHYAWQLMFSKHDMLRTSFTMTTDKSYPFAQVVLSSLKMRWETIEVSDEIVDTRIESQMSHTRIGFEETDLPYSFTAFKTPRRTLLLLSMHHALYDGEAIQLLLDEVGETYCSRPTMPAVPFEPLLEHMMSLDMEKAKKFWTKELKEFSPKAFPKLNLLIGSPQARVSGSYITSLQCSMDLQTMEGILKTRSFSLLSLIQACWAKLISLFLGVTDVCFGNVTNGRNLPLDGIEHVMAPCFNTTPFRTRLTSGTCNADLVSSVQQTQLDVLPYQFTPLRYIHRCQNLEGRQLFDTLLILQKPQTSSINGIWSIKAEAGAMGFPVVCEVTPWRDGNALQLNLHTDCDLETSGHALNLLEILDSIICNCLRYPYAVITDFSFLKVTQLEKANNVKILHNHNAITAETSTANLSDGSAISSVELYTTWNDDEKAVGGVISSLINHSPVSIGLSTSFFRLGLDSINAVQIAAQLRERGWKISPIDVLAHPTIRQLALYHQGYTEVPKMIERQFSIESFDKKWRETIYLRYGIGNADIDTIRPCTPAQLGILASFLKSNGIFYFNAIEVQIPKSTLVNRKLQNAWGEVIAKYEILRAGFASIADRHCPFAMLTYRKSLINTFLQYITEASSGGSDLQEQARTMGQKVLPLLHMPPWRIEILRETNTTCLVHVFLLHALFDATSLNLIIRDFQKAFYDQKLSVETPISFLLASILEASEEGLEQKEAFWKGYLEEVPITRFPNLTPLHTQSQTMYSVQRICKLSTRVVRTRCQDLGITMQSAGQASWACILSAYTGEPSVIFGSVFSGRTKLDSLATVAFPNVTSVPVVANVNRTYLELAEGLMNRNPYLLKHQFTPMSKIRHWTGHNDESLFDTVFVYQNVQLLDSDGMKSWKISQEYSSAEKFSVSVELIPTSSDDLTFRIVAREDVLPREQALVMLKQLERVLNEIINNPSKHCTDCSSLPSKLLSITPAKEPYISSEASLLHQFLEIQAHRSPWRIGFEFALRLSNGEISIDQWTYAELNKEADKVASYLVMMGTKTREMIAICFNKCPEATFAILGILKAGCAFVAIDPEAPIHRQDFILRDSRSSLLLTMRGMKSSLSHQINIPIICLDKSIDGTTEESISNMPRRASPELQGSDLCYCLYTSGTTGTPKACLITHENAVQAMMAFRRVFHGRWNSNSRFLQFASFHFDVCILEQFWSWSVGICVTSAPRDLILEDIGRIIRELRITHLDLTPSLAKTLNPDHVPSLYKGVFITGGEKLQQEILEAWGSKECIYNGYGPTETTIGNTMLPRVPKNGKASNIGPQFDNVGTYVLRSGTNSPVLRGAVGELCIAGKLVGSGYLNRPELTNEKFPFLDKYCERVYRTGDLVRILHDGTFDFVSRIDDQVKLRGQRLEIAEINETIKSGVDGVRDMATFVIEHPKSQRKQLVTFFVPSRNNLIKELRMLRDSASQQTASIIREVCRGKLPPYMVPSHFIPVNYIPLSSNNKVESKRLRSLYNSLSSKELQELEGAQVKSYKAAHVIDKRIIDLIVATTGYEASSINRHSNIFRLGVDSISIVGFTRKLKEVGFHSAQISMVMQSPTVGDLSDVLTKATRSPGYLHSSFIQARQNIEAFKNRHLPAVCKLLDLPADNVENLAPCTPLQEGIISRSLASDNSLYFEVFCFELSTKIKIDRMKEAWVKVIVSAQMLRTCFCPTVDGYAQVVIRNPQLPWTEDEFRTDEDLQQLQDSRFENWRHSNTDLLSCTLEIHVFKSEAKMLLVLHIFHALYDGMSLPIILRNVIWEYDRLPGIDYGPAFVDALPSGPLRKVEGAEDFWKRHFQDFEYESPLALMASRSQGISVASLEISMSTIDEAREFHATTHQAIIQAAWTVALRKYFPSELAFAMVVSGRSMDFEGVEKVIGPLFNTIAFYMDTKRDASWADIIKFCHKFNAEVLPFQHSPMRDIIKWCKTPSQNALFQTLFTFQTRIYSDFLTDANHWIQKEEITRQSDYPLSFEAELLQEKNTLQLSIIAQEGVSNEDNSLKILNYLENLLQELLRDSDKSPLSTNDFSSTVHAEPVQRLKSQNHGIVEHMHQGTTAEENSSLHIVKKEVAQLIECDPSVLNQELSVFTLGLDSIDIVKLSSRLRRNKFNISVGLIMRSPTLVQIAGLISNIREPPKDSDENFNLNSYEQRLLRYLKNTNFDPSAVDEILPPTPVQEAIVADMFTNNARYLNQDILRVLPSVDVEKLKTAWKSVIDHSPLLRTSFVLIDDPNIPMSYAQIIHQPGTIRLHSIKLQPGQKLAEVLQLAMKEDRTASFNGIPLSLSFIHDKQQTLFALSISHALYDGWSLSLLHNDIYDAYNDQFVPRPSYKGFLRKISNSHNHEASQYWKSYMSGARCCLFARRPETNSSHSQVHRAESISSISRTTIETIARRYGISLQALGQLCWALTLAFYLETLDVTFGVVLSGRDTEESTQLMFPTMNTVVVRSVVHGSAKQMLYDMQADCANANEYQHFPLRKVLYGTDKSQGKVFESLFIFQNNPPPFPNRAKLYESVESNSSVEFPVCVEMELIREAIVWRAACEDSVFDGKDTETLLEKLETILHQIVESPEDPVLTVSQEGIAIYNLPTFNSDGPPEDQQISSTEVESDKEDSSDEWDEIESIIRKVLSEVSHVLESDIGKQQTIFNLGLDSISTIKAASLLKKRTVDLSVSDMLKAASISHMAQIARKEVTRISVTREESKVLLANRIKVLPTEEILLRVGIDMNIVEKVLPCSPGQVFMLSNWYNSGGEVFNSTFRYQTSIHLIQNQLEDAWNTLSSNFPILRTTFASTNSREIPFIQIVLRDVQNPIVWLSQHRLETQDLSFKTPPLSLEVIEPRAGTSITQLYFNIHHALYDAISFDILIAQFEKLYNDGLKTPQIGLQFEDFLAYELTESSYAIRKAFWCRYLSGIDNLSIPHNNMGHDGVRGERVIRFRSGLLGSIEGVHGLAKSEGLDSHAIFLAVYAVVHMKLLLRIGVDVSLCKDLTYGIYLANRSIPLDGIEDLATPTMNVVPLRVCRVLDTPVISLARQVQQDLRLLSNADNSRVGLWEIYEWTGVKIDCFINFLTLPDSKNAVNNDSTGLRFEEVPLNYETGGGSKLASEQQRADKDFRRFQSNAIQDVYMPSIDIEAAVRHGALAVGIFYPTALRGSDQAEWVLDEMSGVLNSLLVC